MKRVESAIYNALMAADTKRDLYKVGGFPEELSFTHFYGQFRRNGWARAGVMRPASTCWSTPPKIFDFSGEGEPVAANSQFEQDVKYLIDKLNLFKWMYSLDYRQRVGRYGGIIIVGTEASGKVDPKSKLKIRGGVKGIKAFRPVFEGQIECGDANKDITSVNFGNPVHYNFKPSLVASQSIDAVKIDASRVFVFGEGADDGSIYGTSCLESGFNSLMDMFKCEVAGAEGIYKNARQRLHVNITDQAMAEAFGVNGDSEDRKSFDEALADTAAGFDNELITAGMDLNVLQSMMSDPTGPFNIALQGYCTSINIPKTILIGFETGERSSSENRSSYNDDMNSRRENVCSQIIKGFLEHLIEVGGLTAPTNGIKIVWDDLNTATDKEMLELSDKMTSINERSVRAGMGEVYTSDEVRVASGYGAIDEMLLGGGDGDGEGGGE